MDEQGTEYVWNAVRLEELTQFSADNIRPLENHQGIISKFSINADGKSSRPIFINTIQDGQLILVVKVN